MKFQHLLIACVFGLSAFVVPAQMTQLNLTLDVAQMANPDCWLNQGTVTGNKVYFHSGLCTSNPTTCDSIGPGGTPIFQHVVGNWGMDDGVGLMAFQSGSTWTFSFIIENYYSNNISAGSTAMPPGATPYTIGLVFRDLDGTFEGKDDQCGDIFIRNIQGTPEAVNGSTGLPFFPLTVTKTSVGVETPGVFDYFRVGPNPFSEVLRVEYYLRDDVDNFSAKVFNNSGQEVVTLTEGTGVSGAHQITWQGNDNAGQQLANGVYYLSLWSDDERLASEKVLLFR
ncbi:MAG: FlgD immunoglobulin-like domain containing protein [Bacteroidota bacterium]